MTLPDKILFRNGNDLAPKEVAVDLRSFRLPIEPRNWDELEGLVQLESIFNPDYFDNVLKRNRRKR